LLYPNPLLIIGGWIAICIAFSILSRKIFPNQKELSRKIIHIGIGPIILLAWWFQIPSSIAISCSAFITSVLIINYRYRFIPEVEDIQRQSYGTIAYGVSITLLLILLWSSDPSAVSAGILVMAFADGLAGLIGKKIKSPNWKVLGQTKSIAGTIVMALVTATILVLVGNISTLTITPLNILSITSIAVILEQISPFGIDNITVPIAVAYAWGWIIQ